MLLCTFIYVNPGAYNAGASQGWTPEKGFIGLLSMQISNPLGVPVCQNGCASLDPPICRAHFTPDPTSRLVRLFIFANPVSIYVISLCSCFVFL